MILAGGAESMSRMPFYDFGARSGKRLGNRTLTDGTLATFAGDWTVIIPTGSDEDLGVRVVGDGAFDPTFYRIELQMRTLRVAI